MINSSEAKITVNNSTSHTSLPINSVNFTNHTMLSSLQNIMNRSSGVHNIQYYPYALVVSSLNFNTYIQQHQNNILVNQMSISADDVSYVLPIFLIICLIYGFYPIRYHGDDYFNRKGFVAAITEYRLVKKILYIEIPLLIFFAAIFYAGGGDVGGGNGPLVYFFALQVALQYSVTAGTLWLLSHS
jgi:hypothetical protein